MSAMPSTSTALPQMAKASASGTGHLLHMQSQFLPVFAGLTDLEPRTMPTMRETSRSSRNGYQITSTAWASFVSAGPQKRTSTSTPWHISTTSLSSPCLWWRACQMCPTFSTWCPTTPRACEFFTMAVDGKYFDPYLIYF